MYIQLKNGNRICVVLRHAEPHHEGEVAAFHPIVCNRLMAGDNPVLRYATVEEYEKVSTDKKREKLGARLVDPKKVAKVENKAETGARGRK